MMTRLSTWIARRGDSRALAIASLQWVTLLGKAQTPKSISGQNIYFWMTSNIIIVSGRYMYPVLGYWLDDIVKLSQLLHDKSQFFVV